MFFEALSAEREPTRAALHGYSQAAIAINRAHGIAHPKYWHVSLKVRPRGFWGDPVPLPDGGVLDVALDLVDHSVVVSHSGGARSSFSMQDGASTTEMGNAVTSAAREFGLEGPYDSTKFEGDQAVSYEPAHALSIMSSLVGAYTVFERHRVSLAGPVSPVQLWPHGFDLSMEWFGTKSETFEGEELPSQLNLGFYPAGDAYFYSNPWPFDDGLLDHPLPHGAQWHTEGWQGSMLPYDLLVGDPAAESKLQDFARAVFDAAAPTLTT